jgi:tripartite-type tricarboxylate transporter receptor subunit TctC
VSLKQMTLTAACIAIAGTLAAPSPTLTADMYPSRPVHIVVPFPPGGLNDTIVRIMQPYLQEKLGQPFVIDNKQGASGMIGTEQVAKAAPDGYTLLVVASSHTVAPAANAYMAFDTENDLAPVSLLIRDPNDVRRRREGRHPDIGRFRRAREIEAGQIELRDAG